ncbi:hypothetical protein K6689_004277 [Vibrio parahaemolyticus]|nr:hypothetical protein [Vibrio parahaemolyticus]EHK6028333.1 hypothetical protein [Vibrio parahaemolyticus]EIA1343271.1 hypothetical protein [Vibrio parahaemolyticus]EIA1769345.1 hypothetical protein [Vibrio parahaemolyticus]
MANKEMNVLLEQLNTLSLGINPFTGTAFLKNSKMHSPEMIRCLISVKDELHTDYERKESEKRNQKLKEKKTKPSQNLPERHGLKWTEDETIQVIDAFQTDIHPKDIAKIHKRKVTAIIAKLESKGLIDPDERESYL